MACGISRTAATISPKVALSPRGSARRAARSASLSGSSGVAHRPQHAGDGHDRADHEGRHRGMRDAAVQRRIAVQAPPHEQAGREVGEGLGQAGEGALDQEARGLLHALQPVADVGAVGLHRHVVGRIQDPQQAGREPQRRAEGHEQQAQAAHQGADQEVGRAPAPAAVGAVAHRADDRLHQQAGDRPGQPQQRQAGLVGTEELVDRAHIGLLQPEAVLDPEESEVHAEQLPQGEQRFPAGHGQGPACAVDGGLRPRAAAATGRHGPAG